MVDGYSAGNPPFGQGCHHSLMVIMTTVKWDNSLGDLARPNFDLTLGTFCNSTYKTLVRVRIQLVFIVFFGGNTEYHLMKD
jgi:hypothetical protein